MLNKLSKKIAGVIPVWLVVLMIPLGSAVIINLLSNTLTAQVTTEIPLEVQFTGYGPNDDSVSITENDDGSLNIDLYAGSTFYIEYQVTNHANNDIYRFPVLIVESQDGLSQGLQEIQKVEYYLQEYYSGPIDITDKLYYIDENGNLHPMRDFPGGDKVVLFYNDESVNGAEQGYLIRAGETLHSKFIVTTSPATYGTFNIIYEEVFDLSQV